MANPAVGFVRAEDKSWRRQASCRGLDPALFHPPVSQATTNGARGQYGPETQKAIDAAKAVCRLCPVIMDCRRYALTTNQDQGVWGGLSERERRALLKRTRRSA